MRGLSYLNEMPQADAKSVARIRVGGTEEPKTDGATSVAGHVEVVAAPADRMRVIGDEKGLLVRALRIEVIEDNFPNSTTHVR